jgi:hypothetical protein
MQFSLDDEISDQSTSTSMMSSTIWENDTNGTLASNEDLSLFSQGNIDNEEEDEVTQSSTATPDLAEEEESEDMIPKSFLQLRGISVANYNMGCHFNIGTAIRLMMQNDLFIIAIQVHTPWSRQLSDAEIKSIHRTCDKYQFCATISKVQIILIDKQIPTSTRDTSIHEERRMIQIRLEISHGKYANFHAKYGYPDSPNNRPDTNSKTQDESSILRGMRQIQKLIKSAIEKVKNAGRITLYIL